MFVPPLSKLFVYNLDFAIYTLSYHFMGKIKDFAVEIKRFQHHSIIITESEKHFN